MNHRHNYENNQLVHKHKIKGRANCKTTPETGRSVERNWKSKADEEIGALDWQNNAITHCSHKIPAYIHATVPPNDAHRLLAIRAKSDCRCQPHVRFRWKQYIVETNQSPAALQSTAYDMISPTSTGTRDDKTVRLGFKPKFGVL